MKKTIASLLGATILLGAGCGRQNTNNKADQVLTKDYSNSVGAEDVERLKAIGISEEERYLYTPFQIDSIEKLHDAGIDGKTSSQYLSAEVTSTDLMIALHNSKIDPVTYMQAKNYFSASEMLYLQEKGISIAEARDYTVWSQGNSPGYAIYYPNNNRLNIELIIEAKEKGIVPSAVGIFNGWTLSANDKLELTIKGVTSDLLNEYGHGHSNEEILKLIREGVDPKEFRQYIELNKRYSRVRIDAHDVIEFKKQGRNFEEVEAECKRIDLESRVRN